MKRPLQFLAAFISGAVLAAAVTTALCLRWKQQQDQQLWVMFLDRQISMWTLLERGDREKALADLKNRIPGAVESVNSFGHNGQTVPILRRVGVLYDETGEPVPTGVQKVLSKL